jgi:fatty acid desaturase
VPGLAATGHVCFIILTFFFIIIVIVAIIIIIIIVVVVVIFITESATRGSEDNPISWRSSLRSGCSAFVASPGSP